MKRKTMYWIIGGVLAVGCLALVVAIYLGAISIPSISQQLEEGTSLLSVQIVYPPPRSEWPLNSFIPIRVMARGAEPITKVELYINNSALSAQEGRVDTWAGHWDWQPGAAGVYILTAKATGKSGAVSLSDPVRITTTEASFSTTLVTAQGGETLAGVAQEQGVSLESLQAVNPAIDPAQPVEPGKKIFVPNAPAPVMNENIIDPLPESEEPEPEPGGEAQGPGDADGDGGSPVGNGTNIIDAFSFMQQMNALEAAGSAGDPGTSGNVPDGLPAAPELSGSLTGCDVKLVISGYYIGAWEDEDGFFVYRSRDGGGFERIFTLGPVETSDDAKNLSLVDPKQYGDVTYYVSAFNVLGESASNPVTFPMASTTCQAPARAGAGQGQIQMQDGNLILPYHMDVAYMYLQINGAKAVRVPEGNRTFLPSSGVMFNVLKYLDSLGDALPDTDIKLHGEVWGWSGGVLKFVGEFDEVIHRTVLMICSVPGPGNCAGSTWGDWVTFVDVPQGDVLEMLDYDVRWQVSALSSATGVHFSLAALPFTSEKTNDSPSLLWATSIDVQGTEGTFVLPLGQILYPDPPHPPQDLGPGWGTSWADFTTNGFLDRPAGQPFMLYLRAEPSLKTAGLSDVSNVVILGTEETTLPSDLPPLASPYDSIYDVEILEETYSAPSFYDEELWGCVEIEADPSGLYQPGEIVCPGKFKVKDQCEGLSELECVGLGTLYEFGWLYDQIIYLYEEIKTQIIQVLWAISPYCDELPGYICKDAIHVGVDYAAQYYTGIPNDAPSSDEMISDSAAKIIMLAAYEGEKYYTEKDYSVLEKLCAEELADCENRLSKEIEVKLKENRTLKSQVACISGIEAMQHGQNQACLDPVIACHAAPGSANVPAMVLVRVTRKTTQDSIWVPQSDDGKYRLLVTVDATRIDPGTQETTSGPLYKSALVPIPWLEPGESTVLPATLKLLGEEGYGTRHLYWDGVSKMKAVEACYSPDSTWDWVPCENGGQDTWEFDNPKGVVILPPAP
jgi:LysM repeat protein